jgi:hypothetical protein
MFFKTWTLDQALGAVEQESEHVVVTIVNNGLHLTRIIALELTHP